MVMIDEEFSQFGETVANGEKSKVRDVILAQNQSFYTMELL